MGLLSRLKNISTPKLVAFLEESDQPELLIPQLQDELIKQLKALRNAEVKSLTAVRAAQRRLEETMGRALRLERGAELALKKGDEATAREALREQVRLENTLPEQRRQVEQVQKILDDVRERTAVTKKQIELVEEKKEQLKIRRRPIEKPLIDSTEPLLNQVARMEEDVYAEEAELAARQAVTRDLRKRSLDERLLELEKNEELNRRLAHLKKDIQKD
jgi:phage shock protein A